MSTARIRLSAVVALALIGVLTGCGSSSKQPANATTAGASQPGSSQPGAALPGVAESNPAGDIPDNQAFIDYRDSGGLFRVAVPEGWAQTTDAGAVLFSDKYNNIRIQTRAIAAEPTTASVTSTDLPAIAASEKGYRAGKVSTVPRKGGQATLATYQANSATNPVTGKYAVEAVERYVFYRAGHEVILTLAAPVGSDNVDPWRKVTDSFSWLR